jgi:hypothetical protein
MAVRTFIRLGLTWGCLFGLYLLFTGQTSRDEVVAGALTSAAATILSLVVRRSSSHKFDFTGTAWLRPLATAVASLPREVATVAMHLISPNPASGILETEPLSSAPPDQTSATFRAVRILAASFAPNSYGLAVVRQDRLLLHRLVAPRRQGSPR